MYEFQLKAKVIKKFIKQKMEIVILIWFQYIQLTDFWGGQLA